MRHRVVGNGLKNFESGVEHHSIFRSFFSPFFSDLKQEMITPTKENQVSLPIKLSNFLKCLFFIPGL